jgi:hypothetical protein
MEKVKNVKYYVNSLIVQFSFPFYIFSQPSEKHLLCSLNEWEREKTEMKNNLVSVLSDVDENKVNCVGE